MGFGRFSLELLRVRAVGFGVDRVVDLGAGAAGDRRFEPDLRPPLLCRDVFLRVGVVLCVSGFRTGLCIFVGGLSGSVAVGATGRVVFLRWAPTACGSSGACAVRSADARLIPGVVMCPDEATASTVCAAGTRLSGPDVDVTVADFPRLPRGAVFGDPPAFRFAKGCAAACRRPPLCDAEADVDADADAVSPLAAVCLLGAPVVLGAVAGACCVPPAEWLSCRVGVADVLGAGVGARFVPPFTRSLLVSPSVETELGADVVGAVRVALRWVCVVAPSLIVVGSGQCGGAPCMCAGHAFIRVRCRRCFWVPALITYAGWFASTMVPCFHSGCENRGRSLSVLVGA